MICWNRADPNDLDKFDVRTKICTMNCGPHKDDPRSEKERRFLCGDCIVLGPDEIDESLKGKMV